jgi:DNA-binding MarR family transcriptional regulator
MRMANTSSRRSATTRFDSLEQEAFLSLWRTYDRLRALEDEFFRPYDLTPQQYNVLRLLKAQQPALLPTLDVANRLVSRAPDITRMLDKLAQRGLVSRVRSESDRRTVLVGITPAGTQLLAEMHEPLRACHERQLGHLPPETLLQLIELLRQVRDPHEPQESSWH